MPCAFNYLLIFFSSVLLKVLPQAAVGSWDTEESEPEPGGQGSDPGAGVDAAAKPSWGVL